MLSEAFFRNHQVIQVELEKILLDRSALKDYQDALECWVGKDICWNTQWWSSEEEIECVVAHGLAIAPVQCTLECARRGCTVRALKILEYWSNYHGRPM